MTGIAFCIVGAALHIGANVGEHDQASRVFSLAVMAIGIALTMFRL